MELDQLVIYLLRFYIPGIFSVLFRAAAFGYSTKKRLAVGLIIYTLYVMLVPAFLMNTIGYGAYTHIAAFVMMLGSMVVLVFTTDSPSKTIFLQLAQTGMTTSLSVTMSLVRTLFNLPYPLLLAVLALCCPLIFFIGLKFWARPLRFLVDNIHDSMAPLLTLPLITFVVVTLIPIFPEQNYANHPVFCTAIILLIEGAFFLYLYTLYRNIFQISFLLKQESRTKLLAQEIESYKSYLDSARQVRHDIRHHDMVVLDLLNEGAIQEATDYLHSHVNEIYGTALTRFSEDATTNAMLRMYERQAQEAGIAFSATAHVPEQLPVDKAELGALLGNALENALRAASSTENGFISVDIHTNQDNMLIEVRNSVLGKTEFRKGLPISKRVGGGTGTRSIMRITESHKGVSSFTQKDNEFQLRLVIPLTS